MFLIKKKHFLIKNSGKKSSAKNSFWPFGHRVGDGDKFSYENFGLHRTGFHVTIFLENVNAVV